MSYLCDTCILIDYLRGDQSIQQKLSFDIKVGLFMSSVTDMDLMVGARNKQEAYIIKKAFANISIIDITESISRKSRQLIDTYSLSHGLQIPDALIAATAIECHLPLYTANIRDFRFIPNIELIPQENN